VITTKSLIPELKDIGGCHGIRACEHAAMPPSTLTTSDHIELLGAEAVGFASSLTDADLDATVVTCPDWTVRDLVSHVGGLHRWSTELVANGILAETWRSSLPLDYPDDTAPLEAWCEWLRTGAADACRTFATAEPAARVWAWGADQHARFWPRRMLFETAIHRLDLDLTLGRTADLPVGVAVEGIDEQLENLPFVARWNGEVGRLRGAGETLGFAATDADASWRVRLEPDGWWWDRGTDGGDVVAEAEGVDLLLLLVGRPVADLAVRGDRALLDRWLAATVF
jgi:uncharacterized protein (TIGR03083 family)